MTEEQILAGIEQQFKFNCLLYQLQKRNLECSSPQRGIAFILEHYSNTGVDELPEWVPWDMNDMPRYTDVKPNYHIMPNEQPFGEICVWIVEKLKGKWATVSPETFYFELEADAIAFKLRWY